jgi:D-arabinose 1-dehydrogenase-like Zn-dependent alcohol dehydrogenase
MKCRTGTSRSVCPRRFARPSGIAVPFSRNKALAAWNSVAAFSLLFWRRSLSGSIIGGIRETQEMLDYCGEHRITADVEVIPIQKVNEAYERLLKSDVKYHAGT